MAITKVSASLVDLDGGVVINESSADADFRVESNGNANMLFVDGGNDYVSIGASTDLSGALNITHGSEFGLVTSGGYNYQAKFESTDAEAAIVIEDSNSGTDYNRIGVITNDMTFITNNSERMRIDSNGNIAIGGTSASNFSGYVTLDLRDTTGGLIDFSEASAGVFARIQAVVNNSLNINNRQAYPLTFGTNDTERMRIDSSGNVGIGTTAPNAPLTIQTESGTGSKAGLRLNNPFGFDDLNTGAEIIFSQDRSSSEDIKMAAIISGQGSAASSNEGHLKFFTRNGGTIAERVRITSGGVALFGKTSTSVNVAGGYIDGGEAIMSIADASNTYLIRSTNSSSYTFYVSGAGTVNAVTTSISSLSDKRLKENIKDIDTGLSEIIALKPRKFDWKEGEGSNEKNVTGFIAQEVETVLPDLIGDFKHEELEDAKAVRMGDMLPTLVKAIQELSAEVEELKTKLESK